MTPEAKVKAAIKKWLSAHGFWLAGGKPPAGEVNGWMHMPVSNGMGVHGLPDFCGVFRGHALYIEAKAPGGVLSENQKKRHEEITAAGGTVLVAYDTVELDKFWLEQLGRK